MAVEGSPLVMMANSPVVIPLDTSDTAELLALLAIGFLFGLYLIYRGTEKYRKYALVRNTPTETVRSVALGRTELEGTVRSAGPLVEKPFDMGECLYAEWEIAEYRYDGDDSKSWQTVESGTETVPFLLEGTGGSVVVDPPADTDTPVTDDLTYETQIDGDRWPGDMIAEFCESVGLEPRSGHKRRYTHTAVPPGTDAYVFGQASRRENPVPGEEGDRVVMGRDESSGRFILSDKGDGRLQSYFRRRSIYKVVGGLALSTVCLAIWLYVGRANGWQFAILGTAGMIAVTIFGYGLQYAIRQFR